MANIGRNDPCPCGSGKKYKRCCLANVESSPRHTQQDRHSAFARLKAFSDRVVPDEDDRAYDELWGALADRADEFDEELARLSTDVLDMWFWFDRRMADGRRVADRLLAEDPSIPQGERHFLERLRDTTMRQYEVVDVCCGSTRTRSWRSQRRRRGPPSATPPIHVFCS